MGICADRIRCLGFQKSDDLHEVLAVGLARANWCTASRNCLAVGGVVELALFTYTGFTITDHGIADSEGVAPYWHSPVLM